MQTFNSGDTLWLKDESQSLDTRIGPNEALKFSQELRKLMRNPKNVKFNWIDNGKTSTFWVSPDPGSGSLKLSFGNASKSGMVSVVPSRLELEEFIRSLERLSYKRYKGGRTE